ncbi:enhanced serine sensitivity protein SseB C-terminal domain-containing protein [Herbiconiux sp. CPCC 205716]|uniref:Enhanced serine sensitivity protein SseB C-terminal domain-containing protein n=1 Tax=Herbiconiux gentiana TaxID=2970912 RepID=A0ABT2GDJ5_9MICO|nr:enhanced serine sensitivity protein SseB C-terminal domain-containing protein [Herbiconiux gentiana]MCS5714267.1 enhanced serine sensitivity protein SseB C-terminal domain-containing protein [Herbiconiux gentiana]
MSDDVDPRLEQLLQSAATDRAAAPAFVEALLRSTVIVPGRASGDRTVQLADLLGADGRSVQPFYTSEGRLRETLEAVPGFERSFLAMPCRALWEMTRGATLVLNPHSPYGKEFLPGEIGQLLDGEAALTPRVAAAGERVMVGEPAQVPPGMTAALAELFAGHPDVSEAVLGWTVTPPNDASYLLVIVGPESLRSSLGAPLARALATFSAAAPVDVLYSPPGARHLLHGVTPFYRRARRGRGLFGRR